MSNRVISHLPVPNITDHLSYSFKQFNDKSKNASSFNISKKPPKLQPKSDLSFNRSLSSTAQVISFKQTSDELSENCLLQPIHCKNKNISYFEQCFEEISKIGEGSFGEVFRVKSKEDGQFYAIKKSKHLFRSETYRQERLEEVKRYEEFSKHEHCITLYKAWQQDYCLYMQMELCKCSLDSFVADKMSISEAMVWSFLLDLLLALKSLHDKNLIHLDIKLDNILLNEDDVCKLGDFGLVIDLNRKDLHLATEGDSRYIAPELLHGEFSKAADIFSLGITMLELSCNLELPPNGPLWQELRSGQFPRELRNLLSTELQHIIKSMMDPQPTRRPSVNTLLSYPKLQGLLQRRKSKWFNTKKMKLSIRNFWRLILRKMCNLKSKLKNLLSLKHYKKQSYQSSDERLLLNFDDASPTQLPNRKLRDNVYNSSTPIITKSTLDVSTKGLSFDDISNSTPLRHFSGSNLSSRIRRSSVTRPYLNFDSSEEDILAADDCSFNSNTNYPQSKIITSSPMICKKLFAKYDDSD